MVVRDADQEVDASVCTDTLRGMTLAVHVVEENPVSLPNHSALARRRRDLERALERGDEVTRRRGMEPGHDLELARRILDIAHAGGRYHEQRDGALCRLDIGDKVEIRKMRLAVLVSKEVRDL